MKHRKKRFNPRNYLWLLAAVVFALLGIFAAEVTPVEVRVHANFGYTLDSLRWLLYQDTLLTDSSTKITDVTEWPDTVFDLAFASRWTISFHYWAYGFDSAVWNWYYDLYDYNNANCVGGGAYVARFLVRDTNTNPDVPIDAAKVTIHYDSSTGAVRNWWWTDGTGYVEFGLDNGDYSAVTSKPGLASAAALDFTIASAGYQDTIDGYMIEFPAAPGGPLAMASVNVFYFKSGAAVKGARLIARNQNVATDTVNQVVIGPVQVTDYSNSQGLATVSVPKSYIFHDTLKGLYDISLYHGSKLVKLWEDYWVPDQDTVRLVVEE
jgi:hypothetical protein